MNIIYSETYPSRMEKIPRFFTGKYTTEQLVKNKWRGEKKTLISAFPKLFILMQVLVNLVQTISIPAIVTIISIKLF